MLDKLLIDAAAEAGAEVREGFGVERILVENGLVVGIQGHSKEDGVVSERARVVIGADGPYSRLAQAVQPEEYNTKPKLLVLYYSYWRGLPMNGRFEVYIRPNRGLAGVPTHDQAFREGRPYDEAMSEYQRVRDENALPMYEFTCESATLKLTQEMLQLFSAMEGNQEAMDRFVQVNA
ncbi:MAG TPA: hypothetical protein VNO14_03370 [Blastocatellia bacterium]|nr:hypothetical protein [Blastocatellia bacterium]